MNRTSGGGPFDREPDRRRALDRDKRRLAAQILGQAYVSAYNLVVAQQGRGREDRRRARRAARDVRRRAGRDPRRREAEDARDRLRERGRMAEDVTPRHAGRAASPSSRSSRPAGARARRARTASASGSSTSSSPPSSAPASARSSCSRAEPEQQPERGLVGLAAEGQHDRRRCARSPIGSRRRTGPQNGAQLTVSLAGPLSVPTPQGEVPVRAVFVRPDTSKGLAEEDDIAVYPGQRRRLVRALRHALEGAVRGGRRRSRPSGRRCCGGRRSSSRSTRSSTSTASTRWSSSCRRRRRARARSSCAGAT